MLLGKEGDQGEQSSRPTLVLRCDAADTLLAGTNLTPHVASHRRLPSAASLSGATLGKCPYHRAFCDITWDNSTALFVSSVCCGVAWTCSSARGVAAGWCKS